MNGLIVSEEIKPLRITQKLARLLRSKTLYFPQDYCYEKLINRYKNLDYYLLQISYQDKQALFTDKNISFSTNQLFKKNQIKYVKKKYGKPIYTIINNYPFGKIKIHFYRIKLGYHNAKMELHFYNDSLFLYNYSFSYLKNTEQENILQVLKKKYLSNKQKGIDPLNSYIIDNKNSAISFSKRFDFTINYVLDNHSELFHKMNSIVMNKVELQKHIKNLNSQELYSRL